MLVPVLPGHCCRIISWFLLGLSGVFWLSLGRPEVYNGEAGILCLVPVGFHRSSIYN